MNSNILIKNFFEGKIQLWKSYWLVGELLNGIVLLILFNLEIYFLILIVRYLKFLFKF